MSEILSMRVEESFLEKIDAYAKSKDQNRTRALRNLIELGLKLDEIRDDNSSMVEEEFQKLQLEIFLRVTQIFKINEELVDKASGKIKEFTDQARRHILKKYPNIFEKFKETISPNT